MLAAAVAGGGVEEEEEGEEEELPFQRVFAISELSEGGESWSIYSNSSCRR
jgi:hypothetical protein